MHDLLPAAVDDRYAVNSLRQRRLGELGRTLGDDEDATDVDLGKPRRVLLELVVAGQAPAPLCLEDDRHPLALKLDVGKAAARQELLQAHRSDFPRIHAGKDVIQETLGERLALCETPADGVGEVVLLVTQEIEDRRDRAAVEGQLGHDSPSCLSA